MKVVSLFTGIGGIDLGLKQAGHEIILMCECDPGAQQVLRVHFPGVLLLPDVTAVQALPAETELVAAGFPCIDVSRAGLRKGIHQGASTGLVRHVFRLLDDTIRRGRPVPWVLLENVEALLDRHGDTPPAVHFVTAALESLGYHSWAQRTVCSAAFGVPNRRKRVFIVASWHGDARDVLLSQGPQRCLGSCSKSTDTAATGDDDSAAQCFKCHEPDVDDLDACSIALDLGNARSAPGIDLVPTFTTSNKRICLLLATGQMGMLRIEDAERLQGFPAGWTEPAYPVVGPGVAAHRGAGANEDANERSAEKAAAARFMLIGNAVTVQVAYWLGQRLRRPYTRKYIPTENDLQIHDSVQTVAELDIGGDVYDGEDLHDCADNHGLLIRSAGDGPSGAGAGTAGWQAADVAVAAAHTRAAQQEQRAAPPRRQLRDRSGVGGVAAAAAPAAAPAPERSGSIASSAERLMVSDGDASAAADADAAAGMDEAASGEDSDDEENRTWQVDPAVVADADAARAVGLQRTVHKGSAAKAWPRSWPKAAWWLRGGLRYRTQCSDAPVKIPLQVLHEFITTLGPLPPQTAMHTYVNRLREHGWNVWRTVQKALKCGAHLDAEVSGVLRLPGANTDRESIGELVWAPAVGNEHVRWPAEALDPLHPPKGRTVPREALAALNQTERLALQHAEQQRARAAIRNSKADAAPAPTAAAAAAAAASGAGSSGAVAVQDSDGSGGAATAAAAAADAEAPPAKAPAGAAASTPPRSIGKAARAAPVRIATPPKMLVVYFGTARWAWMERERLLDFDTHELESLARAESLKVKKEMPHPRLFDAAVEEARAYHRLRAGATGAAAAAAAAQVAATNAANVNNMPRCRKCEACVNLLSSGRRRCLLVRAFAAAAAGHTGGQIAILGSRAVGAKVQVWWPLDEDWYPGVVTGYDELRVRHTVNYKDGDVEIIPLWKPTQMIKLTNTVKDFAAEAATLEASRAKDAAAAAKRRNDLRSEARVAMEPQTDLETDRQAKMQKNEAFLQQLLGQDAPARTPGKSAGGSGGDDADASPSPTAPATPSPGKGGAAVGGNVATPGSPAALPPPADAAGSGGKGKKRGRATGKPPAAKAARPPRKPKAAKAASAAAAVPAAEPAAAATEAAAAQPPVKLPELAAIPPPTVGPMTPQPVPPLAQDDGGRMHAPPPRVSTLPPLEQAEPLAPTPATGRTGSLAAVASRACMPGPGA